MNKENLIEFENEIASIFNEGKIRAPIHLYSGNEDFLINFFNSGTESLLLSLEL